ncbi:uncharacterized protein BDZ99DRAFT_519967 [Mytilinidion resinicola]|uniref:Uncharacterized protein n=1 Tax=Mytilinidion resinicola TaxID=574789 RepID=A0A6A6YMT9_9PEZI|nr:uncharacterized protein BDZ99DRAFT_519967 [Mytilinidion resinicola]KAF2809869.1 hypothetical protein BDZ99DRAFT_519967 [Mytilinidion resinicola]
MDHSTHNANRKLTFWPHIVCEGNNVWAELQCHICHRNGHNTNDIHGFVFLNSVAAFQAHLRRVHGEELDYAEAKAQCTTRNLSQAALEGLVAGTGTAHPVEKRVCVTMPFEEAKSLVSGATQEEIDADFAAMGLRGGHAVDNGQTEIDHARVRFADLPILDTESETSESNGNKGVQKNQEEDEVGNAAIDDDEVGEQELAGAGAEPNVTATKNNIEIDEDKNRNVENSQTPVEWRRTKKSALMNRLLRPYLMWQPWHAHIGTPSMLFVPESRGFSCHE